MKNYTLFISTAFLTAILLSDCAKKSDPLPVGGTTDIDGNSFDVVTIGTQIWMAENLKVTTYNDGKAIPLVTDNTAWDNITLGGYCWYNNEPDNYKNLYGGLYHWTTVNTGKLCPTGWHVPTDAEWTTMTTFLGGESVAGGKLKETGTTHWLSPNEAATNEIGFTALPGGIRGKGGFSDIGNYGIWWSSTERITDKGWYRLLWHGNGNVGRDSDDDIGLSVRCIKN